MQYSDVMKHFIENVQCLLRARGMTQGELASRARIPRPNINRILNGTENVSLDRAARIADAFGISLSDLLDENLKKMVASN